MKYILDKNILTNDLANNIESRNDLCITEDVIEEAGFSKQETIEIRKSGVQILKLSKKHLLKLIEIMKTHGGNLKLINLYGCKGTADVSMIAYIEAERNNTGSLFPENYTIVTNDAELITTARMYQIDCIPQIPSA